MAITEKQHPEGGHDPAGTQPEKRCLKVTIGTLPEGCPEGHPRPMNRKFTAFPTSPCDDCLGDSNKHLETDAGLALYCEHESALALCEHNRWRVISPLTFDEAAAVLEACVTARKLPEVEEDELPGERDFQPWQPQRIWTSPARSDASPTHRRPKAPAR